MKTVEYKGWKNCIEFKNNKVTMIVTADVGPRIIFFALNDGDNIFQNYPEMMGKTGTDEWTIYGGHRLWAAPEKQPRTYYPDNNSVEVTEHDDFVRFTAPVEKENNIQKEMDVYFGNGAEVKVVHRITNHNVWGVELAPWALSVMKPGGKCIIPLPAKSSHSDDDLLPTYNIVAWSYTNMADERWHWGDQFLTLTSQVGNEIAQKAGAMVLEGWTAYANENWVFITYFDYMPEFMYPDMGVNFETFTDGSMLEVETLAPMSWLKPGESVEHPEIWQLHKMDGSVETEEDIKNNIVPLIKAK